MGITPPQLIRNMATFNIQKKKTKSKSPFRKHPHIRDNRPIIQKQRRINEEHEQIAQGMGLPWRIVGASILHRYPTLSPDIPKWEADFVDMRNKIDNKNRQAFKDKTKGTDLDIIPDENPSFDEIVATLPFKPASRITPADEADDRRSMDRKMAQSLYLVVKRNRENNMWQFPQGKWLENETLRETAERINNRSVGNLNRWFISNAPMGHYCYAYPKELQQQRKQYGAKVFFYRSQYLDGDIKLETRLYTDYAWIARSEVGEYFDPDMAEYLDALLPN